jgi:Transmembrane family 220, helix
MKFANILLALMFLSFTVVQYNDPDPWLWIFIYGSMTALCILAARERYFTKVMLALIVGFLIYAALLSPGMLDWWQSPDRSLLFDDLAKMQYYYIEEAREFLGLMICLAVLGLYVYIAKKRSLSN